MLRILARPCRIVPGVDEFAGVVFAARAARLERPRHEPAFAGFDQFARFEIRAVIIERDADGGERADETQEIERVRVGFHLGAQDAELVAFSHNQFTASAVG